MVVTIAIRRGMESSSPVSRLFRGLISDVQVRGIVTLLAVKTLHAGGGESGGQQRALHRISWLAGQEHFLHVIYQRAEEIRQAGAARRHGEIHLGGEGLGSALDSGSEVEILHQA